MINTIENLVFEGGGVRGIAYAGAIQVLETEGLLKNIKGAAGTSTGAITAALISLNYNAADITEIIKKTNFKHFEDHWNPIDILTHYGLYKGEFLLHFIEKIFAQKGLAKSATFEDFKKHGCKNLKVFASDLNIQMVREFSYEKTPKVIVTEAIRASASIPLLFRAWSFSNCIPNNHIYIDGGLTYNFPIAAFDIEETNYKTLGFHFKNLKNPNKKIDLKYDEPLTFAKTTFNLLLKSQIIDFEYNPSDKKRTVNIDDFGISATKFELTEAEKIKLYNSGKNAMLNHLKNALEKQQSS